MVRRLIAALTLVGALAATSAPAQGADVKHGKRLFFQRCSICHSVQQGAPSPAGPNLFGVVGRRSGSLAGFNNYSEAMKSAGITWTEDELVKYLENPEKIVPGTHMSFQGFSNPNDAADVAAFLKTQQ